LIATLVGAALSATIATRWVVLPLLLTTLLRILWLTWLATIFLPPVMLSVPATRRIGHRAPSTWSTTF
jgi:hypothetical protein